MNRGEQKKRGPILPSSGHTCMHRCSLFKFLSDSEDTTSWGSLLDLEPRSGKRKEFRKEFVLADSVECTKFENESVFHTRQYLHQGIANSVMIV